MKPKIKRLRKLATFLFAVPPDKFDFSHLVSVKDGKPNTGCALYYLPDVFPFWWKRVGHIPTLRFRRSLPVLPFRAAEYSSRFFGINEESYMHLFIPYEQRCQTYGGSVLSNKATPDQVARNILHFIRRVKKEAKAEQ